VIPYFSALGFPNPPQKAYPDFIEELSAIPHRFYTAGRAPLTVQRADSDNQLSLVPIASTPASPMSSLTLETAWNGLLRAYRVSEAADNVAHVLFGDLSPQQIKDTRKATDDNHRYNSNLLRQIWFTVARQFLMLGRTATALRASAIAHIIAALVLGSLFWQLGYHQADARSRFGATFFVLDFTAVGGNALVPGIMMGRVFMYPQSHRGYFKTLAYYIAQAIVIIPVSIMESLIIALIVYPMIGLDGTTFISEKWWYYWFTLFLFMVHYSFLHFYFCHN
jgi:hypothetical protein